MASNRREKELARLRAERQAARRAAEAAKRKQRNTVIASTVAVLAVVGAVAFVATRGGGDDTPDPVAASGSPTPAPTATGPCTFTPAEPASRPVTPPPSTPEVSGELTATMKTNEGTVVFTLDAEGAPCASQSFVTLAAQDYFDDTPCHRLTEGGLSVLQCGDPTGTGTGGPGYSFAEENLEGATYPRGTVAMAKSSAPASTGSQFFLVYGDSALPPEYTVVGKITKGLDVLDKIAKGGVGEADENGNTPPKTKVQIEDLATQPA